MPGMSRPAAAGWPEHLLATPGRDHT
jgi:hypothetical protein